MSKCSVECTVTKNLLGKYSSAVENYKELYGRYTIESGFIRAYLRAMCEK
jgi:hypothetical protein